MRYFEIYIATFFFVCLFNVAFIPQLCSDAVQDLQNKASNHILGDESASGESILEEESKNQAEENNEDTHHHIVKILHSQQHDLQNTFENNNPNHIRKQDKYQSIYSLQVSPPPKV